MDDCGDACENCGMCQCITCKKSQRGIGFGSAWVDCGRCDMGCEDVPMENCPGYEYGEY